MYGGLRFFRFSAPNIILDMQQSSPPSQAGGHSFVGRNTGPSDVSYNRPPIRPGNGDSTPKSYRYNYMRYAVSSS